MRNLILKDKNRRFLLKKNEQQAQLLKLIRSNKNFSKKVQWKINIKLLKISKNSSVSRIRNRCNLTGRSRAVHRNFKLSRVILREFISFGKIPGVKKLHW